MIIGITGGRDYPRVDRVFAALDSINARERITWVVTGACRDQDGEFRGADKWAMRWAARREVNFKGYPAQFLTYGAAGGPIRNEVWLRAESPRYLLWFPGGRGTEGCKTLAMRMGIPLIEGEAVAGFG